MERPVKLTPRAQQVAELIALGLTNREIAQRLFLSDRTVEWHIEQILNRLGFSSRTEIAAWIGRTQTATPLHQPRSTRGNLPAPLTTFVGRERDISALKQLLESNRLLTVFGPGGIGKTRLALRVAEGAQASYPDGAWLCDLAPVADPALVGDAVAQALGLAKQTTDRLALARDHLSERTALLVLDNCEHLLAAAADVARDLLAACGHLRVLATSLAPLGVLGEAVWRLQALPQHEAIHLFVERARAAAPEFQLDHSNQSAVDTICRRLEGLPLALELTAPKLRVLTANELVDAVFDLSTMHRSGDRHASLEALASWGYQMLPEDERDLFVRLGVFTGWFEHDDAAAIAREPGASRSLLASLVENSMIVAEKTPRGRWRLRLLETLKAFARARLSESGQFDDARLRHAERMISITDLVALGSTHEFVSLRPKIEAMVGDMRAAMQSLLELRPHRAGRLAAGLSRYWLLTGRLSEGVLLASDALAATPDSFDRCWLLYGRAALLIAVDRRQEAILALAEADSLADLPESAAMRPYLLQWRADVLQDLGDLAGAETLYRQAIDDLIEAGGEDFLARPTNHLAMALLYAGRLAEAHEFAERAHSLQPRNPDVLDTLAQAYALNGDIDRARSYWLEAVQLAFEENHTMSVAVCLEGLAYTAGMRGSLGVAIRLHHYAQHLFGQAEGRYSQPLTPKANELFDRLQSELEANLAAQLKGEGEALSAEEAIQLAQAEG